MRQAPHIPDCQSSSEIGDHGRRNWCPVLFDPRCSLEDVAMRTALDFSPLYRSTVGFDRLFNLLDSTVGAADATHANWPPYNIERLGEDQYRITMAVAGFTPDEIDLVQQENALLVAGRKH